MNSSSTSTPSTGGARRVIAKTSGLAATAAVVGLMATGCGSDSDTADATTTTDTTTTAGTTTAASDASETGAATDAAGEGVYKDGEYSATGSYISPGGEQSIGVSVTLSGDVVTAVTLDRSQTKGTSAQFQEKFDSGIEDVVVGKNIDDLDVSKVAGSSLTSGGFNAAIEEIKQEAKA